MTCLESTPLIQATVGQLFSCLEVAVQLLEEAGNEKQRLMVMLELSILDPKVQHASTHSPSFHLDISIGPNP